jgi:hypothetical protein
MESGISQKILLGVILLKTRHQREGPAKRLNRRREISPSRAALQPLRVGLPSFRSGHRQSPASAGLVGRLAARPGGRGLADPS